MSGAALNTAALSALRDCRLNLLPASVAAAHAKASLSGARELVGKVDDALILIGRLLAGAER